VFESSEACVINDEFTWITNDASLYDNAAWWIPLDAEGEVPEAYAECAMEVELGRLSVARGPDEVREQALTEAVKTLSSGTISLDPAGRLVVTSLDPELGVPVDKTIDSSLSNIAMYEELLEQGNLDEHPDYPVDVLTGLQGGYLDRAAAALGGGADKFGKITVDTVIAMNAFMTVAVDLDESEMPLPINDEGDKYYDFSSFAYERSATYDHTLCYLRVVMDGDVPAQTPTGEYLVEVVSDESVMQAVFGGETYSGGNIAGFAQAADDARATIEFMHSHVVPDELLGACGN
jgi:hypothetical protein